MGAFLHAFHVPATTGSPEDDGRRAMVSQGRANRLLVRFRWRVLPHKMLVVISEEEVRGVSASIVAWSHG